MPTMSKSKWTHVYVTQCPHLGAEVTVRFRDSLVTPDRVREVLPTCSVRCGCRATYDHSEG